MLTVEKSSQTLVFFVIDNFVKSLLQNLGLSIKKINTEGRRVIDKRNLEGDCHGFHQ